jgi:ATP-dependent Zn protease
MEHQQCKWSVQEAMDQVLQGDRKPPYSLSTKLGRQLVLTIAACEGGRALYAADLRARFGLIDDIEKVSIIRRGASTARVTFARTADDDYLVVTRQQMFYNLEMDLAGHAATQVLGFEPTTHSIHDFERARVCALPNVLLKCMKSSRNLTGSAESL